MKVVQHKTIGADLKWKSAASTLEKIKKPIRKNRFERYEYVFSPKLVYSNAWRIIKANGLDESFIPRLQALATDYNREIHGWSIDMLKDSENWTNPDDSEALKKVYRKRIQEEHQLHFLEIMEMPEHLSNPEKILTPE